MHSFALLAVLILQLLKKSQGFSNTHTLRYIDKSPATSSHRGNKGKHLSMSALSVLSSGAAIAAVVAIHEAGHFLAAKSFNMKIESYNVGYGPKIISVNDSKGVEYAFRVIPMGGYVAFPSNVRYADGETVDDVPDENREIVEDADPDLLQNRPWPQRAVVISAGVIANILLTVSLSSFVAASSGVVRPTYGSGVLVTAAPVSNSPAATAGLQAGDIITTINEHAVDGDSATESFILDVRKSKDIPLKLDLIRQGKITSTTVTPRYLESSRKVSIGLSIARPVASTQIEKAKDPVDAIKIGTRATVDIVTRTLISFQKALDSGFTVGEVGGPISLMRAGSEMTDAAGASATTALISFAGIVSVNLAVLNALPFPALDGGQLVFVLLEGLTGRSIPRRAKEAISSVAVTLLFGLGVYTFLTDLLKLL